MIGPPQTGWPGIATKPVTGGHGHHAGGPSGLDVTLIITDVDASERIDAGQAGGMQQRFGMRLRVGGGVAADRAGQDRAGLPGPDQPERRRLRSRCGCAVRARARSVRAGGCGPRYHVHGFLDDFPQAIAAAEVKRQIDRGVAFSKPPMEPGDLAAR